VGFTNTLSFAAAGGRPSVARRISSAESFGSSHTPLTWSAGENGSLRKTRQDKTSQGKTRQENAIFLVQFSSFVSPMSCHAPSLSWQVRIPRRKRLFLVKKAFFLAPIRLAEVERGAISLRQRLSAKQNNALPSLNYCPFASVPSLSWQMIIIHSKRNGATKNAFLDRRVFLRAGRTLRASTGTNAALRKRVHSFF
jgi:hypothetical protein